MEKVYVNPSSLDTSCDGCSDSQPCSGCEEDKKILEAIALVKAPKVVLEAETVNGDFIDSDGNVFYNEPTIVKQPISPVSTPTIPTTAIDNPNKIPTAAKSDLSFEVNLPNSQSPEEVAANQQLQKTIMWGIAAIVVIILILVAIKMFKKK